MVRLQPVIDHFTDQMLTRKFLGFDAKGKGILSEPMQSPLSFAHDDDANHEGLMQEGCPSCFMIHSSRKLPGLNKAESRKLLKQMRAALATFGDENPDASQQILDILSRYEAEL